MKLVVLIPAFNEEEKIEETVRSVSKQIDGVDKVEILVIDDGSTDNTVKIAQSAGADKIVSHTHNTGVGAAFMTGIRNAISMKADIVVTIDGDSQMVSEEIPNLVQPIISKQFDVVIGSRFVNKIPDDYPKIKVIGNKIFTKIVSTAVGQKFSDTQTGFRAYSRDAIMNISVVNNFTYTQEVLIDLAFKKFRIGDVPVTIKYHRRKSKVVKNIFIYSIRALSIIFKSLIFHRPMFVFGLIGIILIGGGFLAKILTINKFIDITSGLSTGLIILGVVGIMLGLLANVVFNRQTFAEKNLKYFINELNKEKE